MHILVIIGFFLAIGAAAVPSAVDLRLPAWAVLALLAGQVAGIWALGELASGVTARRLLADVGRPNLAARGYERMKLAGRVLVPLLFAADLYVLGWRDLGVGWWDAARHSLGWPWWLVAVDELTLAAPYLLMLVAMYWGLYRGDRVIRVRHAESRVRDGQRNTPLWTRRQYLAFHLRGGMLIVLIPLVPLLAIKDVLMWAVARGAVLPQWALLGGLALTLTSMFVLSPLIIRVAWGTRRLPAGPLRERLEHLCRRENLRYRDILVWRTHGVIVNAGVIGYIAPLRYILVTDAAIEQLGQAELEAVFAHEIGHVAGRHFSYFVAFFLGMIGFVLTLSDLLDRCGVALQAAFGRQAETATELITVAATLIVAGWLFGYVSRRFERQADLFAAQHGGCGDPRCPEGCPITSVPPMAGLSPVCPAAAGLFVTALERISLMNGSSLTARSWRHFSVRLRREFLMSCTVDARLAVGFQRHILSCKILLTGISILLAGAAAALNLLPRT